MTTEEFQAARAAARPVAEMATPRVSRLSDVVAAVIAPRAERTGPGRGRRPPDPEQADTMPATMTEQMTSHFQEQATFAAAADASGGNVPPR